MCRGAYPGICSVPSGVRCAPPSTTLRSVSRPTPDPAEPINLLLFLKAAVNDIINGDVSPQYAVNSLFNRELKAEVELDFPKENY